MFRIVERICDDFGFTSTAAITVFMKAVVRERRIPFEIRASSKEQINKDAWAAFLEMRAAATDGGMGRRSEIISMRIIWIYARTLNNQSPEIMNIYLLSIDLNIDEI